MAKKNKNKNKKTASVSAPIAAPAAAPAEFNPDYSNTKRDLKRIAGLAGLFVIALVALSFFLK
ncbi:MAG: hypothetical protein Fur002_15830 [Anaerolineales bacterium]